MGSGPLGTRVPGSMGSISMSLQVWDQSLGHVCTLIPWGSSAHPNKHSWDQDPICSLVEVWGWEMVYPGSMGSISSPIQCIWDWDHQGFVQPCSVGPSDLYMHAWDQDPSWTRAPSSHLYFCALHWGFMHPSCMMSPDLPALATSWWLCPPAHPNTGSTPCKLHTSSPTPHY